MKTAVYYNNNDVRIEEKPIPQIGEEELLVKVMASGICGSDVLEWYRIKKAPIVLGHEIAGEIVKVGKKVKKYKPGQRVFVSHHVPCDKCYYCQNGYHTACETLHTTNFYPGGFSQYLRVPAINVQKGVFVLPKFMSWERATFIEPLGCCLRGQDLVKLKKGQTVLILGSGISGLLHLLGAKIKKAGRVIVTDINSQRLDLAKQLGADAAVNASEDIPEKVKQVNNNRLADLVIVCAGALSAFKQALVSVDRGGTILCFATTLPSVELAVPLNEFWRKEIKLMPSYAAAPKDLAQAIELLVKTKMPVEKLITHRLSLDQAGLGFKLMAEGKQALKVIIQPHK